MIESLVGWLKEPGLVREANFSWNMVNKFTCDLWESDSNPDHAHREHVGYGVGATIDESFGRAMLMSIVRKGRRR